MVHPTEARTTSHPVHQWTLVSTKTTQARVGDTTYRWLHYQCVACPAERHSMWPQSPETWHNW